MDHVRPPDDTESTSSSLIEPIRDPAKVEAWQRYWTRYRPKIEAWCKAAGRRGAELDEVVAMVLAKIVATMKNGWVYDPQQTYRGWLWRVCHSQIKRFYQREARQPARGTGDSQLTLGLQEVPAPPEAEAMEEDLSAKVRQALERVRDRLGAPSVKWQCFQLTALENLPGQEVARRFGLKVGLVHKNKSRVALAIRAEVEQWRNEGP
jgi:RNA polymerase sigma factor (sigma-70 family)